MIDSSLIAESLGLKLRDPEPDPDAVHGYGVLSFEPGPAGANAPSPAAVARGPRTPVPGDPYTDQEMADAMAEVENFLKAGSE